MLYNLLLRPAVMHSLLFLQRLLPGILLSVSHVHHAANADSHHADRRNQERGSANAAKMLPIKANGCRGVNTLGKCLPHPISICMHSKATYSMVTAHHHITTTPP